MSRKAPASKRVSRQQKNQAECDRLLNKLHDLLDSNPSLAHLRAITPPRPGSANAAPEPATDAELFATRETTLNAYGVSDLTSCKPNYSPGSQVSADFGELIGPPGGKRRAPRGAKRWSKSVPWKWLWRSQPRGRWRPPPPKTPD
jgi:hypothetical protein